MASYIENLVSKIGLDNIFQRKNSQPLDRSSIFGSLDDAEKYAAYAGRSKDEQKLLDKDLRELGPTAYIGQIITVYENDSVNVYKINADSKLVLVGGNTSQDIANLTTNVTNLQTSASTLTTNVEVLRKTIEDNAKVTAYALIELKNKINNNNNSGDSGEDDIIQDGIIDCGTF
jgi:hypothetical protein